MTPRRRVVIGALAVFGVLVALSTAQAAEETLQRLLADLWIQVPSRAVSAPPFPFRTCRGRPSVSQTTRAGR